MIKIRENNSNYLNIFIWLLVFVVVQSGHCLLVHIHATRYHNNLEPGGPWLYRVFAASSVSEGLILENITSILETFILT